jgi:poly-beta-hydroxyalkanoate depolymerase
MAGKADLSQCTTAWLLLLLSAKIAAFLDDHQVFIMDWSDASQVPLAEGQFDLSDYIDYCIRIFEPLGPVLHVVAVCQPVVAFWQPLPAWNPMFIRWCRARPRF